MASYIEKLSQSPNWSEPLKSAYIEVTLMNRISELAKEGLDYESIYQRLDEIYPDLNWCNISPFISVWVEYQIDLYKISNSIED